MLELALLLPILFLFLLASLLVALKPVVGWVLIAALIALAFDVPAWPGIGLGSISVNLLDTVAAVLVASTIFRSKSSTRTMPPSGSPLLIVVGIAFFLVFALVTVGVMRGVSSIGLGPALNESRVWLTPFAAAWWTFVQYRRDAAFDRRFRQWLIATAIVVAAVAILHIGEFGLGGAGTATRSADGTIIEAGRPVTSGQAMVMLLGALFSLDTWRKNGGLRPVAVAIGLLALCLIAQHRSVWVAGGVALLIALLQMGLRKIFLATVALVSLLAVSLLVVANAFPELWRNLAVSASDDATYQGRIDDWTQLLGPLFLRGGADLLFGLPFGTGWMRIASWGDLVNYIPHNWYVTNLLRVGVIGAVALLIGLIVGLIICWRARRRGLYLAALTALVVYCWPYNLDWYLAPILVATIMLASAVDDQRPGAPAPERPLGSHRPRSAATL